MDNERALYFSSNTDWFVYPKVPHVSEHVVNMRAERNTTTNRVGLKVSVYPNGVDNDSSGYMSVLLAVTELPAGVAELVIHCTLYSYDIKPGSREYRKSLTHVARSGQSEGESFGLKRFASANDFRDLELRQPSGRVVMYCKLIAFELQRAPTAAAAAGSDQQQQQQQQPSAKKSLSRDMEALLLGEGLADAVLVLGEAEADRQRIKVHRAVLAARSPVFARELEALAKKKKKKSAEPDQPGQELPELAIREFELPVVRAVLHYVYTGRLVPGSEQFGLTLLAAAERYQLDDLKTECGAVLMRRMTPELALENLLLAERYSMSDFKRRLIDFVNVHARRIVSTPAFRALNQSHPHLLAEIYASFVAAESKSKKEAERRAAKAVEAVAFFDPDGLGVGAHAASGAPAAPASAAAADAAATVGRVARRGLGVRRSVRRSRVARAAPLRLSRSRRVPVRRRTGRRL